MYDQETRSRAVELVSAGASVASVSEQLGVPKSTVNEWKARGAEAYAKPATARRSTQQIAVLRTRAFDMYARSITGSDIATKLNVSRSQVYRWITDAKLQGTLKAPEPGPAPGPCSVRPSASAAHLEAHAPAEVVAPSSATEPAPGHTVGELLISARARLGIAAPRGYPEPAPTPSSASSAPAPDYRHTLEVARLRGQIEALTIERDALRQVIDHMHSARELPEG
jgi:transposase